MVAPHDTLTDLAPDSVMQCIAAHLSPYLPKNDSFDLDHDGRADIIFKTYGDAGLGGGSAGCLLNAAGTHVQIAVRNDTGLICCPQYIPLTVADTFNFGDTIDANRSYATSGWIMSESWGGSTAPFFDKWTNIGAKYIGVRMFVSTDTLYGWIQVEASQSGSLTLFTWTIYDFACTKNLHIGIVEQFLTHAKVYPTVSSDRFRLQLDDIHPEMNYEVTDLFGRTISQGYIRTERTDLDASKWAAGSYRLILHSPFGVKTFWLIKE